jgi:23S rRNA G2445 N2-methylase RlmL
MGPGGPGGPGGPDANSPVQKAIEQVNKAILAADAKPDMLKDAIANLRAVRAQVKGELSKAQTDLQGLVTSKQEAILLTVGILE